MESTYLLERRSRECFGVQSKPPEEKKAVKPIPKMSAKRKKEQPKYRKKVGEQINKDLRCKVKSPVCTGEAQGMNHKQKRSPDNLMEDKNLERSCNACNLYCETNPDWAKANGHFISRFKKVV